jgi:hypothetical protein
MALADKNHQAKDLLTLKKDATIFKYLSKINSKSNSPIIGLITVAIYVDILLKFIEKYGYSN